MSGFPLTSNAWTVAIIDYLEVRGEGGAAPRLIFSATMRSAGRHFSTRFIDLTAAVKFADQVIGVASLNQISDYWGEQATGIEMLMPITHAALEYVEDYATGPELDFSLDFRGLALAKDGTPPDQRQWHSEFDPGVLDVRSDAPLHPERPPRLGG